MKPTVREAITASAVLVGMTLGAALYGLTLLAIAFACLAAFSALCALGELANRENR